MLKQRWKAKIRQRESLPHNHQDTSPICSPLSHLGGAHMTKMAEMTKFDLGRVENNVGKGENARYQHFLLFNNFFQKASLPG